MRTWNRCVFTAILRILYQPRRRSDHRTTREGKKSIRRDRSCRSIRPFNQRGAAAGGTRSGILSFARAGQIFSTPFGGSPVEKQGVRGRRDRALSNAREPPPAVFWFLLHRCKRNSPAGEIPLHTVLCPDTAGRWGHRPLPTSRNWIRFQNDGRMRPTPPIRGRCRAKRDRGGRDHRPLRRYRNLIPWADHIRPYGGVLLGRTYTMRPYKGAVPYPQAGLGPAPTAIGTSKRGSAANMQWRILLTCGQGLPHGVCTCSVSSPIPESFATGWV